MGVGSGPSFISRAVDLVMVPAVAFSFNTYKTTPEDP